MVAWLFLIGAVARADIVPPSPPDRGEIADDLPPPKGPAATVPVWVVPVVVGTVAVGSLGALGLGLLIRTRRP